VSILYTSIRFLHDSNEMTLDLSAAVDVYSDWVDACDSVAKTKANDYDQRDLQDGLDVDIENPSHVD
jgi:transcription elongation factor Elf1